MAEQPDLSDFVPARQPWSWTGYDNVVYNVGDEVLKANMALVLDSLDLPPDEALAVCESRRIDAAEDESELQDAFGDIPLRTVSSTEYWDFPGVILEKFADKNFRSWNFDPDRTYTQRPVLVQRQPFFTPDDPSYAQTVGLHIGKAEFFHAQEMNPDSYRRIGEQLLLRTVDDLSEVDMPSLYQVGRTVSILEYITYAAQDVHFRSMLADFIQRAAAYTHRTGKMVDVIPTQPNAFFLQDANSEKWRIRAYEMRMPEEFLDSATEDTLRREFLADPASVALEGIGRLVLRMNYMRTLNVLALACDTEPPFDIRYPYGNPAAESDSQITSDRWRDLYAACMRSLREYAGGAKLSSPAQTVAKKYRDGKPHDVPYHDILAQYGIHET